jgi:hypothetical protein
MGTIASRRGEGVLHYLAPDALRRPVRSFLMNSLSLSLASLSPLPSLSRSLTRSRSPSPSLTADRGGLDVMLGLRQVRREAVVKQVGCGIVWQLDRFWRNTWSGTVLAVSCSRERERDLLASALLHNGRSRAGSLAAGLERKKGNCWNEQMNMCMHAKS